MKVGAKTGAVVKTKSDCLLLTLFQDEKPSQGVVAEVDQVLGGAISALLAEGEHRGKLNQVSVLHTFGKIVPKRVMVTGMGKSSEFGPDTLRKAAGTSMKKAKEVGAKTVSAALPHRGLEGTGDRELSQAYVEGAVLGSYRFGKYIQEEEAPVQELTVFEPGRTRLNQIKKGMERGEILATSQNLVRDLVNEPSNCMTPTALAERAGEVSRDCGLKMQVLERKDMEKLSMGGFLGVARGSDQPPKLIILRHEAGDDFPVIALVGKGITFDSGGISLKPSDRMDRMKGDMAGGAAVIGAMRAVSQLKPKVNVIGLIPATENMPSGKALKPGDIIRCLNGKTVEIISTDAEGRLILADALAYAVRLGASRVFDIATLTGGCLVALGELTSALLGNDQELVNLVLQVSEKTGEKCWQLPMFEEYREQLKSEVADIKNTGGRAASTITAGMFLREFVGDVPWVHMDIAGKEISEKDSDRYKGYGVRGATGVGTRTLTELVCQLAATLII